jgi:hypothetical protein
MAVFRWPNGQGPRVDRLGLALTSGAVLAQRRGAGGTARSLALGSGEYLTAMQLRAGECRDTTRIFYAELTTSTGNTLAGGTTTPDCVTRTAAGGRPVAGFRGRAGDEVDKDRRDLHQTPSGSIPPAAGRTVPCERRLPGSAAGQ